MIYGIIITLVCRGQNKRKRKCRGKKHSSNIYLTFDDGVDKKYTMELLKLLKANEILATFFVVADFVKESPQILEAIKNDGHTIGLHSLSHKNEILQSPWSIRRDFRRSICIMKTLGVRPKFFRPPWGHFSLAGIRNIKDFGLKVVLWDVIVGDWKANIEAEEIAERLLKKTEKGDIICLHDGRGRNEAPSRTIEALKIVIPIWKEKGFTFGTVGELYE